MPYCKCCKKLYSTHQFGKATETIVCLIRQISGYHNLSIKDDICVYCVENVMKVHTSQISKTIVDDKKYLAINDQANNTLNGSVSYDYNSPVGEIPRIEIYLRYVRIDGSLETVLTVNCSLDMTLQAVIKNLIDKFQLSKSCKNIVLTNIISSGITKDIISCTLKTTLRQLDIKNNDHLYFKDNKEENVNHRDNTIQNWSVIPQLMIRVHYSKLKRNYDYQLPYDTTVQFLVSAVMQSFSLTNIDQTRINLTRYNDRLNINRYSDYKLIDLGIGKKYKLLFLSILPEISQQENLVVNMERYINVYSSFLQKTLSIDRSTVCTLLDIKQKISDQYMKETQTFLDVNKICLLLNGVPFTKSSDDHRRVSDFQIDNNATLYARQIIKANEHPVHSKADDTNYQRQRSSQMIVLRLQDPKYSVLKRNYLNGLYNLGNTCFLNSALQCLSHVTPLTRFFLYDLLANKIDYRHKSNGKNTYGKVTDAYLEFLQKLWNGERTSFSPTCIRNAIGDLTPQFATYEQQDAQEFLVFLLNTLHNELQNYTSTDDTIISKLFFNNIQSTTICNKCQTNIKITSNILCFLPISLVQSKRYFEIHFVSYNGYMDVCQIAVPSNGSVQDLVQTFMEQKRLSYHRFCVSPSSKFQEQYDMKKLLSEISENKIWIIDQGYDSMYQNYSTNSYLSNNLTLYDCIRQFVTPETIEKYWMCENQCDSQYAVKRMRLNTLAPVLIVQLKRFTDENGYMQKINTYVDFPIDGLDANRFDSEITYSHSNVIYDLIAISNHMGSVYGGHYTCYARQSYHEPWYLFNDSQVIRLKDQDPIITKDAYILIYLRREIVQNGSEI